MCLEQLSQSQEQQRPSMRVSLPQYTSVLTMYSQRSKLSNPFSLSSCLYAPGAIEIFLASHYHLCKTISSPGSSQRTQRHTFIGQFRSQQHYSVPVSHIQHSKHVIQGLTGSQCKRPHEVHCTVYRYSTIHWMSYRFHLTESPSACRFTRCADLLRKWRC